MKKLILLITILFVSVISTACINNLAVQELNNKAKEYMANGETEKAISRLRSSIDLDTSIFETHYNLGVALIETKEYEEAQTALENAIKLNPDFADSYYSLAVAFEGQAEKLLDKNDLIETYDDKIVKENKKVSEQDKAKIISLLNSAVDNYNKYLVKKPDAQDKEKVLEHIEDINNQIQDNNSLKDTSLDSVKSTSTNGEIDD